MKVCNFCVMDEEDPSITFDSNGCCNHCAKARKNLSIITNPLGFEDWVSKIISNRNLNQTYDGILGLSGGLDSSFVLVKLVESGIKPLVYHVDAGWNSPESVKNIYNLVTKTKVDLQVEVIDWEFVRELQIAFLRSGLHNQDIPQDYLFLTHLLETADKLNIKNIFTGSNYATENILPTNWGENALDYKRILSVMQTFGLKPHPQLLPFNNFNFFLKKNVLRSRIVHEPLNLMSYNGTQARKYLQKNYNWQDFQGKHTESQFTKYFQEVYLPVRFNINKNKAHLSSLIVNNEIKRATVLNILQQKSDDFVRNSLLRKYIANKLNIDLRTLGTYEIQMQKFTSKKFKSSKIQFYIIRILEKLIITLNLKARNR